MIRPENEASQSLYKKLGFVKLYQTVRMTFTPSTWQDPENESSGYFKDNLENAVRQLTIEQKVVNAFQHEEILEECEEGNVAEEENIEGIVEEPEEDRNEKSEEETEGEEESEERIEVTEVLDKVVEETAEEAEEATNEVEPEANVDGTANDDGGDQDDGGTGAADAE